MIRNSDILFGRTAATYQFVDRDIIKNSVKEVSSLQVLGLNKRLSQYLFEKGYLNEDQIYAVQYSLLHSKQIKKYRPISCILFTAEDDALFKSKLGIDKEEGQAEDLLLKQAETVEKEFGVSVEKIIVCLDIYKKAKQAGIQIYLLETMHDKGYLSPQIKEIIPNLAEKEKVVIAADGFTSERIKECIALLFDQVAIVNKKLEKHVRDDFVLWRKIYKLGLVLKYSEFSFYSGRLEQESIRQISATLFRISRIEQHPRFHLFPLNKDEQLFFDKIHEKKSLKKNLVEECTAILKKVQELQINSVKLSDVLIFKGYLTKKKIAKKWAETRKEEVASEVKRLEADNTEETQMYLRGIREELEKTVAKSEEIVKNAEEAEREHEKTSEIAISEIFANTEKDSNEFERELDKEFRSSQQIQRQALQKEIQSLRQMLRGASKQEAKTINTVIGHYQRDRQRLQWSLLAVATIVLFVFIGFFLAWRKPIPKVPSKTSKTSSKTSSKKSSSSVKKVNVKALQEKAKLAMDKYNFTMAILLYQQIQKHRKDNQDTLEKRIEEIKAIETPMKELPNIIHQSKKSIALPFRGNNSARLFFVLADKVVFNTDGTPLNIPKEDITPLEYYRIFATCGLVKIYPWEVALFCKEYKLIEQLQPTLIAFVKKYPYQKQQAWRLFAKVTGTHVPPGGYEVYKDRLVTAKEYKKLTAILKKPIKKNGEKKVKPIKTKSPKPEEIMSKWLNSQSFFLKQKQRKYIETMKKKGAKQYKGRLSSEVSIIEEKDTEQKQKQGQVFFLGNWYPKSKLGEWHRVVVKGVELEGFLKKSNQNLYELRSKSGVRYLKSSHISKKVSGTSPWEIYWKEIKMLLPSDVVENYLLGKWCQQYNLNLFSKIQFERVLKLSPDHAPSRYALGYAYHKKHWTKSPPVGDEFIWKKDRWLKRMEAVLKGLTNVEKKWISLEQAALLSIAKKQLQSSSPQQLNRKIFGGNPRKISKNRWLLRYNFNSNMSLGSWLIAKGDATSPVFMGNGYLQVTSADSPVFASLDVKFTGNIVLKYRVQIAAGNKYDAHVKLFSDAKNPLEGGYLFGLNWRKELKAKKSSNVILSQTNVLTQTNKPTIPAGKWLKVTVIVQQEQLGLNLQGQRLLRTKDSTFKEGNLSVGTTNSKVRFDDIEITANVDPDWYQQRLQKVKRAQKASSSAEEVFYDFPRKSLERLSQSDNLGKWKKALEFYFNEKYSQAFEEISAAIDEEPGQAFFFISRGNIHLQLENTTAALDDFSQAIKLDPGLFTAFVGKAIAHQQQQNYERTIANCTTVLNLAPKHIPNYYSLAQAYLQTGRKEEALAIAKKCIAENPQEIVAKKLPTLINNAIKGPSWQNTFLHETPHYTITSSIDKLYCQGIGIWLEKFYEAYNSLCGVSAKKKFPIRIFSNLTQLQKYTKPDSKRKSHVCLFRPLTKEIALAGNVHYQWLQTALFREATKQILYQETSFSPWLKEGLITYFSHLSKSEVPRYYLRSLQQIVKANKFLPLLELAKLDEKGFYHPKNYLPNQILAYSWIHFLLHGQKEQYRSKFKKLLTQTRTGNSPVRALDIAFQGTNLEKLTQKSLKFWEKLEKETRISKN